MDLARRVGAATSGSHLQWPLLPAKRRQKQILDQDKLTRISLLLGIFKALNTLYDRKLADSWVNLPNSNPMFTGGTPLSYMIKGGVPALVRLRQLLDARQEAH